MDPCSKKPAVDPPRFNEYHVEWCSASPKCASSAHQHLRSWTGVRLVSGPLTTALSRPCKQPSVAEACRVIISDLPCRAPIFVWPNRSTRRPLTS